MPVQYSFSGDLFRIDLEGMYEPEEVINIFDKALADPHFPAQPKFLLDIRKSEVLKTREPEETKMIAEHYVDNAGKVGNRCAILANTQASYSLGSIGKAYAELRGAEVKIFTDLGKALSWLGIEGEAAGK